MSLCCSAEAIVAAGYTRAFSGRYFPKNYDAANKLHRVDVRVIKLNSVGVKITLSPTAARRSVQHKLKKLL